MASFATAMDINDCLYEFYVSTNGPNWYSSLGWDTLTSEDADYCFAYGVECDSDNNIVSISMPMNNIVGEIPACFKNLYTMKELSLQSNYVTGSMANLPPKLVKISLTMTSFTDITSDICSLLDLETFSMSYCELTNVTLPMCLYSISSISIMNSGIHLPEELTSIDISPERKGLSIPGADASKLTFNMPLDEMRELTSLDLSNTGVSGSFNLSRMIFAFPRVQDIYLGGNNLTGWLDFETFLEPIPASVLRTTTINLGSNKFKGILNGITEISTLVDSFWSDLYGIDLSDNSIIGISPTAEELQLLILKHKDLYILNLEDNTFLCSEERASLFDCIDLQITSITMRENSTDPITNDSAGKELQIEILLPGVVPNDLATEFIASIGFSFIPSTDSNTTEVLPLTLSSIFYDEATNNTLLTTLVSSFADKYPAENIPQFNLIWKNMNLTLKLRLPDEPAVGYKKLSNEHRQSSSIFSFDKKLNYVGDDNVPQMTLDVYGMSRCPYFAQFMVNEIQHLVDTYPMASTILNIRYIPLSKPSKYTVSGGYSSHGGAEVTGDYQFVCLQNYTNLNATIMRDYYSCIYGVRASVSGVPYNVTRCNTEVLSQKYNFTSDDIKHIMDCSHSRANEVINGTFSYVLANRVGFSPSLYLENELFCLSGVKCAYNDSSYDVDVRVASLVETICAIYAEKYGEYSNCTQRFAKAAQCPFDKIILGSTCVQQKSVVITVSICCIAFLVCLVLSLIIYSIVKERRVNNTSQRERDKIDALLIDNEESISGPESV